MPSLAHTWPSVVGHVMKSLLSQNNCWLGSSVVDLVVGGRVDVVVGLVVVVVVDVVVVIVVVFRVVVVVWPLPQWPREAISSVESLHFATLNSQLQRRFTNYSVLIQQKSQYEKNDFCTMHCIIKFISNYADSSIKTIISLFIHISV